MLPRLNPLIFSSLIIVLLTLSFVLMSPADAHADTITNLIKYKGELLKIIKKLPQNEKFLEGAINFLITSPQSICHAYWDQRNGTSDVQWNLLLTGAESAVVIGQAIITVSAAGAGSLTGYAGIASAVSTLGLGQIVTATAALLGSNAVGAAATSVVTSAIGGPAAMGVVIISVLVSAAAAANHLTWIVTSQLGDWALQNCQ